MLDGALHSLRDGSIDQAREILETALVRQRATIRELRDLSFALEPVVLRDHGFGPALRALADQAAGSHGISFEVDIEARRPRSGRRRASRSTRSSASWSTSRSAAGRRAAIAIDGRRDRRRRARRVGRRRRRARAAACARSRRSRSAPASSTARSRSSPSTAGTDDPRHAARPHRPALATCAAMRRANGSAGAARAPPLRLVTGRLRAARGRRRPARGRQRAHSGGPRSSWSRRSAPPRSRPIRGRCAYTAGTH